MVCWLDGWMDGLSEGRMENLNVSSFFSQKTTVKL